MTAARCHDGHACGRVHRASPFLMRSRLEAALWEESARDRSRRRGLLRSPIARGRRLGLSCRLGAAYGGAACGVNIDEATTMKTAQGTLLIANGRLVDGTGAPPVADAAVRREGRQDRLRRPGPRRAGGPARRPPDRRPRRHDHAGAGRGALSPHLFRRGRAGRSRHQVSRSSTSRSSPPATPSWLSSAATRRPAAAAACTTSTSGSRRRSRKT